MCQMKDDINLVYVGDLNNNIQLTKLLSKTGSIPKGMQAKSSKNATSNQHAKNENEIMLIKSKMAQVTRNPYKITNTPRTASRT